ncbi:hypothetical protein FRC08_014674 [Ceratobasidium sp. 394]|nr:hypothetical protein FRC08_014674 [Ceratobasidium sp. 394]
MGKAACGMVVGISREDYEKMQQFYSTIRKVLDNQSASPGLFASSAPTADDSDVPAIVSSSHDDEKEIRNPILVATAPFAQDGEPSGGSPLQIPSPEYYTDESIELLSIDLDSDSMDHDSNSPPDWFID